MTTEDVPFTLRAARACDETFLCTLFGQAHAPGLDVALQELQWRIQNGAYLNRFPQAQSRIILYQGQDAGRLLTCREADALRLVDLAILPAFQGRGLGTEILRLLAREAALDRLTLKGHVAEINQGALRFYQRQGWVIRGNQPPHLILECPPAQE